MTGNASSKEASYENARALCTFRAVAAASAVGFTPSLTSTRTAAMDLGPPRSGIHRREMRRPPSRRRSQISSHHAELSKNSASGNCLCSMPGSDGISRVPGFRRSHVEGVGHVSEQTGGHRHGLARRLVDVRVRCDSEATRSHSQGLDGGGDTATRAHVQGRGTRASRRVASGRWRVDPSAATAVEHIRVHSRNSRPQILGRPSHEHTEIAFAWMSPERRHGRRRKRGPTNRWSVS
jgi:hypothetical protein